MEVVVGVLLTGGTAVVVSGEAVVVPPSPHVELVVASPHSCSTRTTILTRESSTTCKDPTLSDAL